MELVRTPARPSSQPGSSLQPARPPAAPARPPARPPPADPSPPPSSSSLSQKTFSQFLSLVVQLAFYKTNPRYGLKDAKGNLVAPAASDATAIVKSLKEFVSSVLPNLNKGKAGEFRKILKSDPTASEIVASYADRLRDWHANLEERRRRRRRGRHSRVPRRDGAQELRRPGDVQRHRGERRRSQGHVRAHGRRTTAAFLDAQSAPSLVVDGPSAKLEVVVEALARCGDIKYAGVSEMSFAMRVRGMLQLVLSEATDQEVVEEILGGGGADGGAGAPVGGAGGAAVDAKAAQMMQKKWVGCWRKMVLNETRLGPGAHTTQPHSSHPALLPLQVLKDLHGYPLWETGCTTSCHRPSRGCRRAAAPAAPFLSRAPPRPAALPLPPPRPSPPHPLPPFPLRHQSIFLYYCGCSIAGSSRSAPPPPSG